VAGPDEGKRFTVAPGLPARVLAGTSPACDIPLTDRLVSRRHVAFELAGARLRVTDLGSTNGTFVQGILVGDAYLGGSELVRIGETVLRVEALGVTQAVGEGQQHEKAEEPQRAAHLHGAHAVDVERLDLSDQVAPITYPVRGDRWPAEVVAARGAQATRLVVDQPILVTMCDRCARSVFDGGHESQANAYHVA